MGYFTRFSAVNEVKAAYRELVKEWHPDRSQYTGHDKEICEETLKAINAEYQAKLKSLNGEISEGDDGREHTYRYNADLEQEIMDKISETIAAGVIDHKGVEMWLVGTWIWVFGETKPIKETLKVIGYRWHSKRGKWYWQNDGYRHKFSNDAFESIAARYGARQFHRNRNAEELATA